MDLIIDSTDKECMVGLHDGRKLDIKKWQWKKDTGSEILHNIEKILKKRRKKLEDIETIFVNQGPGSYTGTRVGITLANALGWSLQLPVKGYSKRDFKEVKPKIIAKLLKKKSFKHHFPAPIYE